MVRSDDDIVRAAAGHVTCDPQKLKVKTNIVRPIKPVTYLNIVRLIEGSKYIHR